MTSSWQQKYSLFENTGDDLRKYCKCDYDKRNGRDKNKIEFIKKKKTDNKNVSYGRRNILLYEKHEEPRWLSVLTNELGFPVVATTSGDREAQGGSADEDNLHGSGRDDTTYTFIIITIIH